MKNLFLLSSYLLIGLSLEAQTRSNLQVTADTICTCMNKAAVKSGKDPAEMEAVFMNCFMTAGMTGMVALAEERGVEITDEKAMHSLGVDVGKELLRINCESFINYSIASAKNKKATEATSEKTEGVLVRIDNKEFRHLVVKDKAGREHSFIWLDYFDGSDKLVGEKAKAFIGKKLAVEWIEKELYLPSAANYFKLKQIAGITLLK